MGEALRVKEVLLGQVKAGMFIRGYLLTDISDVTSEAFKETSQRRRGDDRRRGTKIRVRLRLGIFA